MPFVGQSYHKNNSSSSSGSALIPSLLIISLKKFVSDFPKVHFSGLRVIPAADIEFITSSRDKLCSYIFGAAIIKLPWIKWTCGMWANSGLRAEFSSPSSTYTDDRAWYLHKTRLWTMNLDGVRATRRLIWSPFWRVFMLFNFVFIFSCLGIRRLDDFMALLVIFLASNSFSVNLLILVQQLGFVSMELVMTLGVPL